MSRILARSRSAAKTWDSISQAALDFVFPWACQLCKCSDEESRRGAAGNFCFWCRMRLAPEIPHSCGRCGAALGPHSSAIRGCVHCRREPIRFDSLTCLGMYEDALRNAVLSTKWSLSTTGTASLSDLLFRARRQELCDYDADLVIPIPQSWQVRLRRRFNPASVIAEVLAKALGVRADEHVLRRRRHTRPQKRVSVQRRFDNQKNSFRVRDGHVVDGRRILLVDDVVTTGATCSEAARMLRRHGAKSCRVAVLARVLDGR
ncbi:MAG: ComF family protein [Fuerstiella sp.]|nr:ComF family protein [Fuerstiella sp.]